MSSAKEFLVLARAIAAAEDAPGTQTIARYAESFGALEIARQVKSVTTPTSVGQLGYIDAAQTAFFESMAFSSIFYGLLGSFRPIGLKTPVRMISAAASAVLVNETQSTPMTQIDLVDASAPARKVVGLVAMSRELLRVAGEPGAKLFERELRNALRVAIDRFLVEFIEGSITPIASDGSSAASALRDIGALLDAVDVAGGPLALVIGDDIAKRWLTLTTASGDLLFPLMTPGGGSAAGINCLVSDQARGRVILVNTAGITAGAERIEFAALLQASLQLSTVVDSPPTATTTMVSLWQNNLAALAATQFFSIGLLKTTSIAMIENAEYFSASGNSPA